MEHFPFSGRRKASLAKEFGKPTTGLCGSLPDPLALRISGDLLAFASLFFDLESFLYFCVFNVIFILFLAQILMTLVARSDASDHDR